MDAVSLLETEILIFGVCRFGIVYPELYVNCFVVGKLVDFCQIVSIWLILHHQTTTYMPSGGVSASVGKRLTFDTIGPIL